MAELLLGSAAAGATASTAAAGTAATVSTASTLASTVLAVLSGIATVAGMAGNLQAAETNAQVAESNAIQSDLEAGQERTSSAQRATAMKRELARVLGENDVAIAAAGIDLSGGIAESTRAAAKSATARELSIERRDDEARRALIKARANGYRRQAASYRTGGMLAAVGKAAEFGIDLYERG